MAKARKNIPHDVRALVLHEAGYRCAVPSCRMVLTIELHHLVYVSQSGLDNADNLLALCGNCHALHHMGKIPSESIRTWKFLLMALNEAFDRKAIDLLLAMDKVSQVYITGDGLADYASLIASDFITFYSHNSGNVDSPNYGKIFIHLSEKGKRFVTGWKNGNQSEAGL